MEYPWEKRYKNRKEAKNTLRSSGLWGHIFWFLGAIFAILGIIAAAAKATIGLEASHWLLLAITFFMAAMPMFLATVVAARFLGMEGESKKE